MPSPHFWFINNHAVRPEQVSAIYLKGSLVNVVVSTEASTYELKFPQGTLQLEEILGSHEQAAERARLHTLNSDEVDCHDEPTPAGN